MLFVYLRKSRHYLASSLFLLVLCGLIVYPIAVLFYGSIRSEPPRSLHFSLSGFTYGHYAKVFTPEFASIFFNTVITVLFSTALAVVCGVFLAWLVARTNVPFRGVFEVAAVVPIFISPLIMALSWALLASPKVGLLNIVLHNIHLPWRLNIYSHWGIAFVFGLCYAPYAYMFSIGPLKLMDPSLEESAIVCGANRLRATLNVTLPLIALAILSSAILVFVLTLGAFAVPQVLGNPARLTFITTYLYKLISYFPPRTNEASAISIVLLLITFTAVYFQTRLLSKRQFTTVTGKGLRPTPIDLGWSKYLFSLAGIIYVALAVVLPYFAIIQTALRKYYRVTSLSALFSPEVMGLDNFRFIFEYPGTLTALSNSFILGLSTAVGGGIFYFLLAYFIHRTKLAGRQPVNLLTMAPAAIPGLVIGLGYLCAWIALPIGIYGTLWIMGLAYVARYSPQGVRGIAASLTQIHPELEESSECSGASYLQTLWNVLIPLTRPGIISAMVLVFIISFRELGISIFLYTGRTLVLAVAIFDLWDGGWWGAVCALALIQASIVLAVVVVGKRLLRADILA
jgi:iron(III) transport system permease protein